MGLNSDCSIPTGDIIASCSVDLAVPEWFRLLYTEPGDTMPAYLCKDLGLAPGSTWAEGAAAVLLGRVGNT